MKKVLLLLLGAGAFAAAYSFQLGLEFNTGTVSQVGMNMRFSHSLEIKPHMGFLIRKDANSMSLGTAVNFYLPGISSALEHYAGGGIDVYAAEHTSGKFGFDGHYGLRYLINETINIFGQIGIAGDGDPFDLYSFTEVIGCTIYFLGSK